MNDWIGFKLEITAGRFDEAGNSLSRKASADISTKLDMTIPERQRHGNVEPKMKCGRRESRGQHGRFSVPDVDRVAVKSTYP